MFDLRGIDIFRVESRLWIAQKFCGVHVYDYTFYPPFSIDHPYPAAEQTEIVARIGAIADYKATYTAFAEYGFRLVNTPEQHERASELAAWYPHIADLTPKSKVYKEFPSVEQVLEDFSFPVFIKGNRQTSKHQASLSIATNADELASIAKEYRKNTILHWQDVVCREYQTLQPLGYDTPGILPPCFEFRTFWWKGECVGAGHYWWHYDYSWTEEQKEEALSLARRAALRLDIPFLVIDLALTTEKEWIIIECNDAQESGYAGVPALSLWKTILHSINSPAVGTGDVFPPL